MDHDRQLRSFREAELVDEDLGLSVAWRVVAVVVEPDLSHRDNLGVAEQALERVDIELRRSGMGMDPRNAVDALVLLDDREHSGPREWIGSDRDDPCDADLLGAGDCSCWIFERVEMRVRVDHAGVRRLSSSSTISGSSFRKSGSGSRSF